MQGSHITPPCCVTPFSVGLKARLVAQFAALGLLLSQPFVAVYASPAGGTVVGGSGDIHQNGVNTVIHQASQRMAIDWQSFDIGRGERVQFIQPNRSVLSN